MNQTPLPPIFFDYTHNEILFEEVIALIKASKAHWGYCESFMRAYMQDFAPPKDYLQLPNTWAICLGLKSPMTSSPKLIGFYALHKAKGHPLELDHFFIAPSFIGQGYGKMLFEHVIHKIKKLEFESCILWSDPNADAFYEKMGCIAIGQHVSELDKNRTLVCYRLPI